MQQKLLGSCRPWTGRLSDVADPNKLKERLNALPLGDNAKTPGFWDAFGDAFARCRPKAVTTRKILQVIEHVLEFEKLSPASTSQRLHKYVLRNYTEEGRRIVYHRARRRQALPPVVYNAKFYESALRAAQGGDRRRKLTPEKLIEARRLCDSGVSIRQLAKRYNVAPSTMSDNLKHSS